MIPSVSVVVPCTEPAEKLESCVVALLDLEPSAEIVMVDEGWVDGALDAARRLVARARGRASVLHRDRGDLAGALDAGVRATSGTAVICVDPCEPLSPGFVQDALSRIADDFDPGARAFTRAAWERAGGFAASGAPTTPVAGARAFATVAFADELVAHPELLEAYRDRFSAHDDATLVIYAPDAEPAALGAQLEPVLAAAGLDCAGAVDLMGVAVPAAEGGPALASSANAVLSRAWPSGPLAEVPRFDDSTVGELRELAERTWGVPEPAPEPPSMERFYSRFISPGDLVFDIGANLGNRTETFLALGARVVAVEPQAELVQQLRARWDGNPDVTVLDCALSDSAGEAEMLIADAHTLSTLATGWVDEVKASGRFAEHSWNERRIVKTRTLASLIEEHGAPVFCKIDVEGFEATVLAGLDRPLAACSLEFASENMAGLRNCLDRLASLGPVECNYSEGESMELSRTDWIGVDELMAELMALPGELPWGDVYIRACADTPRA